MVTSLMAPFSPRLWELNETFAAFDVNRVMHAWCGYHKEFLVIQIGYKYTGVWERIGPRLLISSFTFFRSDDVEYAV